MMETCGIGNYQHVSLICYGKPEMYDINLEAYGKMKPSWFVAAFVYLRPYTYSEVLPHVEWIYAASVGLRMT